MPLEAGIMGGRPRRQWGPWNTSGAPAMRQEDWMTEQFGADFAKTHGLFGRHGDRAMGTLSGLLNQPGYGFQMSPQWGAERPNPMYGVQRGYDPHAANDRLAATLMGGSPSEYMHATRNPANMALEQLLRTRQLGQRYQQMAEQGILSPDELARIGGQMDASTGAATGAYRRAAARNRQQMARGANTRQPGAVRARDNMMAQSLDSEAQIGAQYAGQNQGVLANLLANSLMQGRQMGLVGMGQANANLGNFIANRGWDTSVENRFGPSAERQLRAQVPMQQMGAQNALAGQWYGNQNAMQNMRLQSALQRGLMNRDFKNRWNLMGYDANLQNQLADNAKKREGSFGQWMQAGQMLGSLAAAPFTGGASLMATPWVMGSQPSLAQNMGRNMQQQYEYPSNPYDIWGGF